LLGVFFWAETKIKTAMLPVSLMKDRRFVLVSVQTLVLFAGFQSAMYFLSFLYIQAFGYTALQAGCGFPAYFCYCIFYLSARWAYGNYLRATPHSVFLCCAHVDIAILVKLC
jgi:hypothetical protein